MSLINLKLFTPQNVVAIGAIIFFWGAMMFFAGSMLSGGSNPASAE